MRDEDPAYQASRIAMDGNEKRRQRILAAILDPNEDEVTTAIGSRTSEARFHCTAFLVRQTARTLELPTTAFSAFRRAYSPGSLKNLPPSRPKAQGTASILQARNERGPLEIVFGRIEIRCRGALVATDAPRCSSPPAQSARRPIRDEKSSPRPVNMRSEPVAGLVSIDWKTPSISPTRRKLYVAGSERPHC